MPPKNTAQLTADMASLMAAFQASQQARATEIAALKVANAAELEAVKQAGKEELDAFKQQSAATVDALKEAIGTGELERMELETKVAAMGEGQISLEQTKAMSMMPSNLGSVMEQKIQLAKDVLPKARVTFALLNRGAPDIEGAKEIVGQIYRLANNQLAGADLAKQFARRQLSMVDHYYDQARSTAVKPAAAGWVPEAELVKHEPPARAAKKIIEAELAREDAEKAAREKAAEHNKRKWAKVRGK